MKTLTFSRGISVNGKTLSITDQTNTYGTDLPARNTLALVCYITYKFANGTLEVITPAIHSVSDVVTFNINVEPKDGIYYFSAFALPKWTSGPLSEGDIVYNTNDGKVSKVISDVLTPIEVSTLVGNDDVDYGDIDSKIITQLIGYRDQLELIKIQKLSESLTHACEEQEYLFAKKQRDFVASMLDGAHIDFCGGLPLSAQQKIETGINYAKKALNIT